MGTAGTRIMEIDGVAGNEGVQPTDASVDAGSSTPPVDNAGGGNPAWGELLNVLPEQLHPVVKPHLEKWDRGVQTRFEQVQSQFNPYKPFAEKGVQPHDIEVALAIAEQINTDPQKFYGTMQQYLQQQGIDPSGQGQQNGNQPLEFDLGDGTDFQQQNDPRLAQFEQQQQAMAQWIQQQEEQRIQQQADAELEAELKSLQEKHGQFDMQYVLSLAAGTGMPLENAVQQYNALVQSIRSTPTPGQQVPSVLPPGGGVPTEQTNPAKLSSEGRQAVVQNMLRAAAAQNNQP